MTPEEQKQVENLTKQVKELQQDKKNLHASIIFIQRRHDPGTTDYEVCASALGKLINKELHN